MIEGLKEGESSGKKNKKKKKNETHHIAWTDTGLKMCWEPQTLTLKPLEKRKKNEKLGGSPYTRWWWSRFGRSYRPAILSWPETVSYRLPRSTQLDVAIFDRARPLSPSLSLLRSSTSYPTRVLNPLLNTIHRSTDRDRSLKTPPIYGEFRGRNVGREGTSGTRV